MNKQDGLRPFISLILSTKISKAALIIGLTASVLTTIAGLVVPYVSKYLPQRLLCLQCLPLM